MIQDNQEPSKYSMLVLESDKYMQMQSYKKVCELLAQAKETLEEDDKEVDNDFNARAALLAIQSGQGEEALKLTEMVNLTSPGTLLIHAVRGWSLKEIGYEKRAQSLFTFVLDMVGHTDSIMDSFGAAISSQLIGSELALFFYNQLIDQYNNMQDEDAKQLNKIWLIHALLKKYELLQQSSEKKECLLRVLELSNSSVGAYNMLGEAFFRLGRYELSLECYMESIALNPEGQWFRHIRASILLLGGGRISSAIGLLDEYREFNVEIGAMYSAMSVALQVLKAPAVSSNSSISLLQRLQIIGVLFFFLKHFEASQLILRAAMSMCANEFDYHIAISLYQALRYSRRYEEAIEVLESIRNSSSTQMDHPPLLALLADLHSHVNNNETAEVLYLKVIQLQPLEAAGLYKYVKFLNKQNRLEDSLNVIQKAIYLEPKKIKLLIMKALIFSSLKRLPEAYATYEEVLQINSRLQSTRFQLSQINYVLRKYSLSFDQMMQIKKGEVGYEKSINLLIKLFVSQPDALTPEQREFGRKQLRDNLSDHLQHLGEPNEQKREFRKNNRNNMKRKEQKIEEEEEEVQGQKEEITMKEQQITQTKKKTKDQKKSMNSRMRQNGNVSKKGDNDKKEGKIVQEKQVKNGKSRQSKIKLKVFEVEEEEEESIEEIQCEIDNSQGVSAQNKPQRDQNNGQSSSNSTSEIDSEIEDEQEQEEFEIYKQLDEDPMDSDEELEELEQAMHMPKPYEQSFIEYYLSIAAEQEASKEVVSHLAQFLEANTYPIILEIQQFLQQQGEFKQALGQLKQAMKGRDIRQVLLDSKLDQLDQGSMNAKGKDDQENQILSKSCDDAVYLPIRIQLLKLPLFSSLGEEEEEEEEDNSVEEGIESCGQSSEKSMEEIEENCENADNSNKICFSEEEEEEEEEEQSQKGKDQEESCIESKHPQSPKYQSKKATSRTESNLKELNSCKIKKNIKKQRKSKCSSQVSTQGSTSRYMEGSRSHSQSIEDEIQLIQNDSSQQITQKQKKHRFCRKNQNRSSSQGNNSNNNNTSEIRSSSRGTQNVRNKSKQNSTKITNNTKTTNQTNNNKPQAVQKRTQKIQTKRSVAVVSTQNNTDHYRIHNSKELSKKKMSNSFEVNSATGRSKLNESTGSNPKKLFKTKVIRKRKQQAQQQEQQMISMTRRSTRRQQNVVTSK